MCLQSPYPPSPLIQKLTWDPVDRIIRRARGMPRAPGSGRPLDGSDNWPITWADDDNLYTAYGDGYGFDPPVPEKLSLGFARIVGDPPKLRGINIRSSGEHKGHGRTGKKASGILMVGGTLYMWLFHADENGSQAQLAWSRDHARTWCFADWKFAQFGLCTFINFGRNYAGARDGYVYTVSHDGPMADGPADRMILMRVPQERVRDRNAYEYFYGLGSGGGRDRSSLWSRNAEDRKAVFEHQDCCLRSGISYSIPLKRYLWWQHIPNPPGHDDRGDTRYSGGFGIYDAPEPWGPWTTAYFTKQWDVGPGERAEFPPRWMSRDGRTLHLVFSGDDTFSVRKAYLTLS